MEEELYGIDRDDFRNSEDSPEIVFLDEKSRKMVESLLEILKERRSQTFYKPIDFHS